MIEATDMIGSACMVNSVVSSVTTEDQRQNRVKYAECKTTDKYVKQKITSRYKTSQTILPYPSDH